MGDLTVVQVLLFLHWHCEWLSWRWFGCACECVCMCERVSVHVWCTIMWSELPIANRFDRVEPEEATTTNTTNKKQRHIHDTPQHTNRNSGAHIGNMHMPFRMASDRKRTSTNTQSSGKRAHHAHVQVSTEKVVEERRKERKRNEYERSTHEKKRDDPFHTCIPHSLTYIYVRLIRWTVMLTV